MIALALLFILSGAAGLIYESVWARYISLLVGHSAYAQVIVLVMFLGGMAIGSLAVGKRSERIRSPLLWYAVVEAVIALIAMVFHPAFIATTSFAYDSLLPHLSPGIPVTAATWTLAALLILPQSILLGATFPLMTAGAVRRYGSANGASIGLLYFANSFGAAIGALVSGFFLVGAYGLRGTLIAAALLNAVVAAGVGLGFVRRRDGRLDFISRWSDDTELHERPVVRARRILLAVAFVTAFSSFLYEIAWTRMLSLVNGSATHSFEIMLSAFILGLAAGSLWISRRPDTGDQIALLGRMQWCMGLAAIATLPLYLWSFDWMASLLHALQDTDAGYRLFSISRYAIALVIMLPATFCAGTTLPLITKILLSEGSGERAIGAVYGVNTIGSIVGAGTAALVLVPLLGLKWVLIGGGVIDVAVGIGLLAWRPRDDVQRNWTFSIGATLAAIVGIAITTPFSPVRLGSGVFRYKYVPTATDLRYLFYRDGRTASVGVRQDAADTTSLMVIATNGKPDASMPPAWAKPAEGRQMALDQDMSTQILLPLLVLVHAPASKHGAVIGQGSGITSHILLTSPTIEKLHTIEIEPEMIHGSRLFYPGNRRVFDDPRNSFEIDDARAFMAASGQQFDFVVSEPSNPWVSGVSGLFTVEFYQRIRKRLSPTGVFVQWFHMYEMDDASVSSVLAGIDRVFGDYRLFVSSNSDIIIVASPQGKLPSPDWSIIDRFPELAADLRHFPPLTPETLDATIVAGRQTLSPFLSQATVNSDFLPILDLNGERSRFRNLFADGFRALAESQFDVAAALEDRRRPLGTIMDNPAPEIVRAAQLATGARLRTAKSFDAVEASGDSALRAAEARSLNFQLSLVTAIPPRNWSDWIDDFLRVESDLHGGAAGSADEAFYRGVRAYLARVNAPAAVNAVVDFRHGLAAWQFDEAVRASDTLVAKLEGGETWMPVEQIRRGGAVARLRMGDANAAARLFANQVTLGGEWSVLDRILQTYIARRLVSRGGASGAPAPPRH